MLRYLNFWAFTFDTELTGGCHEKLMYVKEAKMYTQKCEDNSSCMVLALSPADIRECLCWCSFVIGTLRAEMSERQL